MEKQLESVRIGQGISLDLASVESLKVLNDKLLVTTYEGICLQVTGLPSGAIDALFTAFARHTSARHATVH